MTNGFAARWKAEADRYADDLPLFLESQWVVRNLPREAAIGPDDCIVLMPHQREILDTMFKRDEHGEFGFDEMLYSTAKKSGKTEIEGGVGEWLALFEPGLPEIYTIANDKEQSRTRAFNTIRQQVVPERNTGMPRNPVIARMLRPLRDSIETSDGGFIKTVAIDFAGESGANPTASLWDELWGVDRETQRRLWDEFTPVPTRLNSIRFVSTYAGFKGESELLWELYERIVGGDKESERKKRRIHPDLPIYVSKDGRSIAYWDDGPASHRMPWQTEQYYRGEKARLRPSGYDRLHNNYWVNAETNFITPEDYDALTVQPRRTMEQIAADHNPIYLTVDAAHKRDCTAAIATEFLPVFAPGGGGLTRRADHAIWQPNPGRGEVVIPDETAEPWIRERIKAGWNIKGIGYDPAHFETPAARLARDFPRIPVVQITQSVANLTKLGSVLFDSIHYRTHIVYNAVDLREHFLNAKAIDTGIGFRVVKGSNEANKIDGCISEGMGIMLAQERGPTDARRGIPIYIGGDDDEF